MAMSCNIFEIKRYTGRKSRIFFHIPPAFDAPVGGGDPLEITFGTEQLEWRRYWMVKSLRMCSLVSIQYMNVIDGQTDTARRQRSRYV